MRKLSILLLAGIALSSCQQREEAKQEPVRPVLSIVATPEAARSLTVAGTIEPRITTELGFRVLGRVVARNVSVGDIVKKGDVVAAIDPLALELSVKSTEADLSNAEAQQENAASTQQRQQALAQSRSGTEVALEQAEQGLRTANATVAKAKANLDKAREQLGYAQLHAEFDGVVTATSAEVGQTVSAGQSVVTIARPDVPEAVIDMPEGSPGHLKVGAPFEISLQLDPAIRASGTVREIAPVAETATRTRRVKITLANPPDAFRLGSVITASAAVDAQPTITLPASALLMKDTPYVWVVDETAGKVNLRQIKTDGVAPGAAAFTVAEGVKAGERIVTAGVHKLTDGQAVKIDERNSL